MKHFSFFCLLFVISAFIAAIIAPAYIAANSPQEAKDPIETLLEGLAIEKAPPRAEGDGPFNRIIIHGGTLIDGTGALPIGPMQIVIENNRITKVQSIGSPDLPVPPAPIAKKGEKVMDVSGMYILPGFIDMFAHIGTVSGTPAEYVFKLQMGHGITTIREPGSLGGLDWTLDHKIKSAKNEITAPRIFAHMYIQADSPKEARKIVSLIAKKGADGLNLYWSSPKIYEAILDEAKKLGLRSACHLSQMAVGRTNILDLAHLGLTTTEHWYGLPELLLDKSTVQDWPPDSNYNNAQNRFGQAGRLWQQAAPPYSEKWNKVINELIEHDLTLVPTFVVYEANRDLMRARRHECHEEYTLPVLWRSYKPDRLAHGSYFYYWTTEDEVAWKKNFSIWMKFVNEYKNHRGRAAAGSDSGFAYNLYGFGYIRELELLREAGFHPLEVIRAATLKGAEALGMDDQIGTVEVGKLADLVIVKENPLKNFKVLYGTGAIKLDENNELIRVGGVKYTIKDGIVYDAQQLLADVRRMVRDVKKKENFEILQPGVKKKKY